MFHSSPPRRNQREPAGWIHLQSSDLAALCDEKLKELALLVENNLAWIAECEVARPLEPEAPTSAKLKKAKEKLGGKKNKNAKVKGVGSKQTISSQGKGTPPTVTATKSIEQISSHSPTLASPQELPPLQRNEEEASSREIYNAEPALEITEQNSQSDLQNAPTDVFKPLVFDHGVQREILEVDGGQEEEVVPATFLKDSPRNLHEQNIVRSKASPESGLKELEIESTTTGHEKRQRAAAATEAELENSVLDKPVERRRALGRKKKDPKPVDESSSTKSRSSRPRRCRKVSDSSNGATFETCKPSPEVLTESIVPDADQVVSTINETCSSQLALPVDLSDVAVGDVAVTDIQVLDPEGEHSTTYTEGKEDDPTSSTAPGVQQEQSPHPSTLERKVLQSDENDAEIQGVVAMKTATSKNFIPPFQRTLELPIYKIPSKLPDSPSSENEAVGIRMDSPISKPEFSAIGKVRNSAKDMSPEIEEFCHTDQLGEMTPGGNRMGESERSSGASAEKATEKDARRVSAISATVSKVSSASYASTELELRERRLKDYFNSNTEKLKKALSSLRSAPQQSIPPPAQRAASLDNGSDLHNPLTSSLSTVLSNPRSSDPTSLASSHSTTSSLFPARGKLTEATGISTEFLQEPALESQAACESSNSLYPEQFLEAENNEQRLSEGSPTSAAELKSKASDDPAADKGDEPTTLGEDTASGHGQIQEFGHGDDDAHYRRRSVAQVVKVFEERNRNHFAEVDEYSCNQASVKLGIKAATTVSTMAVSLDKVGPSAGQSSEEQSPKPEIVNQGKDQSVRKVLAINVPMGEESAPTNGRLVEELSELVKSPTQAAEIREEEDLIENERRERRSLGVPVSQVIQTFERKGSASSSDVRPDSTRIGLNPKDRVHNTDSTPLKFCSNLQQKRFTQIATFKGECNADAESPFSNNDESDNPQMEEQNSAVSTSTAVTSPASSSKSSFSSIGPTSVPTITAPSLSKFSQLPPNLVLSTTSFVAELAEKEKAKQLEKEKQRERDRKPEVKALLAAASAAKKEQHEKERRAAARNLGMERHAVAQQKKEAEETKRLDALRKKEEEGRRRAKTALEAKKKEEEDARKRRQDRDRQVQERQRQLAKEREEIQQRVLNKMQKVSDKDEKEADPRRAETKKRIRPADDEEVQRNLSVASSIKKMSTFVARTKSIFEPESEIENKRQKMATESARSSSREETQPSKENNILSTPLTKSNAGFVQMQYTSKGMVVRPRTPLTIFSGNNSVCATPELPEIHTDDDSDDENYSSRKIRPQPEYPDWTQSPAIRQAMVRQSASNPDTIFTGTMRALDMEEIFSCRDKRFRARSSSAQWTGTDRLTAQEELKYQQAMGYKD